MNTTKIRKIKPNPRGNLIKYHKYHNFYEGFQLQSKRLKFKLYPKAVCIAFLGTSSALNSKKQHQKNDEQEIQKVLNSKINDNLYGYTLVFENENELILNKNSNKINFSISFSLLPTNENGLLINIESMVTFYNKLGYFLYVLSRPFHRYLLKQRLRNIEQKLLMNKLYRYVDGSVDG